MRREENNGEIFRAFQKSFQDLQGSMSLEAFAKKLGMSQALARSYLTGTRFPDTQVLQKISELWGVSVDWLLGRSAFRVKENERMTVREMGLSEKAAVLLQSAHNTGEPEGLNPQLVSAMIENEHFARFMQQIQVYISRAEEVREKLKGADPGMLDFYSYRLRAEKLAVTDVLHDLLNGMAPLPELQEREKAKGVEKPPK
ncbi:helix-turn-helix transcriptional regulator [Oscillospiraceae bacterium 21-37]|uniref:helix-turn-helix domain-containing protein n=1 Tax=Acutalibacter sp. JLR.KK004 TaxID=3112622 RepID=UPI002FF1CE15